MSYLDKFKDERKFFKVGDTEAGPGLLADRQQHGELPHGCGELDHVRRERQEGADADVAAKCQPAAERQHTDLRKHRHRLQRRREAGGESDDTHP